MFTFNIGYRHQNGEVEGFVGTGSDKDAAERNAIRKAAGKAKAINHPFESSRLIYTRTGLTKEEYEQLKKDWEIDR